MEFLIINALSFSKFAVFPSSCLIKKSRPFGTAFNYLPLEKSVVQTLQGLVFIFRINKDGYIMTASTIGNHP